MNGLMKNTNIISNDINNRSIKIQLSKTNHHTYR